MVCCWPQVAEAVNTYESNFKDILNKPLEIIQNHHEQNTASQNAFAAEVNELMESIQAQGYPFADDNKELFSPVAKD